MRVCHYIGKYGSDKTRILAYFTQYKIISYDAITKYDGATAIFFTLVHLAHFRDNILRIKY